MKERSILFSGEMVRAILEGRKTQTRRPITLNEFRICDNVRGSDWYFRTGQLDIWSDVSTQLLIEKYCPFGEPGDRLWVRETWRIGAWREDGRMAIDYFASPEITNTPWVTIPESEDPDGCKFKDYWMRITDELERRKIIPDENGNYHWEPGKAPLKWHPSIHMPRWASRIDLEIVDVKVERIQDIHWIDLGKEGLRGEIFPGRIKFNIQWDAIYSNRGFSWDSNPWVWVIDFEVVKNENKI